MSRARRRNDKARMKRKAKHLLPTVPVPQKFADNLTKCSCEMCCNPRHSGLCKGRKRLTVQERREMQPEEPRK